MTVQIKLQEWDTGSMGKRYFIEITHPSNTMSIEISEAQYNRMRNGLDFSGPPSLKEKTLPQEITIKSHLREWE